MLPKWFRRRQPCSQSENISFTETLLRKKELFTVCEEARCPNLEHCFSQKRATFLALGNQCSRSCGFCHLGRKNAPLPIDPKEPIKIAKAAKILNLSHVVITMVTRDDLKDGGVLHIVKILEKVRENLPKATLEVLTSDFQGDPKLLNILIQSNPHIFNHNLETVRRLTPFLRSHANYDRSLFVLDYVKKNLPNVILKSGLMVGVGEKLSEVKKTIDDLFSVGCEIITIGQYLRPSEKNISVQKYITPKQFKDYEDYGYSIGVKSMLVGPYIRSSFYQTTRWSQASKQKLQNLNL